jgi:methylmalonyl-CoA/ethylmalonyl-CoA epimerase
VALSLDHVAIAVPALAGAVPLFEALTGERASETERVPGQYVDVVFIGDGPGRLELVAPSSPESPVARFLERRGPGLHHIAFRVTGLDGVLDDLAARGVELIDRTPRAGAHGTRVAFVHPRSCAGVLIELVEA